MPAPSARIAPDCACGSAVGVAVERHGDLPGDQIAHHRRGAAIGNVHDIEPAGERLELLAAEMKDRAQPGRTVGVFARVLPDQRDETLDVVCRHRRMNPEHRRRHADLRDGREIAHRVVRHLVVEARIDGVGGDRRHQQRVTVRRGLGDHVGADVAARPGLVLDEELLAQEVAHLGPDDARDRIGRSAGREGHHDADRFGGILIVRLAHGAGQREGQNDRAETGCSAPHLS